MYMWNAKLSMLSIHNVRLRDAQCIPVQSKVVYTRQATKAPNTESAAVCIRVSVCVRVHVCERK